MNYPSRKLWKSLEKTLIILWYCVTSFNKLIMGETVIGEAGERSKLDTVDTCNNHHV